MAIQGILKGYACPAEPERNLVLVGRGPGYLLVVNGQVASDMAGDLNAAFLAFDEKAATHCASDWQAVTGLSVDGLTGRSVVSGLNPSNLYMPVGESSDGADERGGQFAQYRDRG